MSSSWVIPLRPPCNATCPVRDQKRRKPWAGARMGGCGAQREGGRPPRQTPSLQNDELIHFCGFKPPNLQSFLPQVRKQIRSI